MLVEICATLDGELVLDRPLHLDGMLIAVQAQRLGVDPITRETPVEEIHEIPIPITRAYGIYRCSAAYFLDSERGRHFWTRRKDAQDVERYDKPFNRGYGPARDLMRRASTVRATEARWLIHTDDLAALEDLLLDVHALGGLRAHGLGRVRGWEVEKRTGRPDDPIANGTVMRTTPAHMIIRSATPTVFAACRPPYWHPGRVEEAVLPGVEGWPAWKA
jgi:hypothetical protein